MDIPNDILYCIFFLVGLQDYPNLALSCRHFSTLLLDENLWRKHCVYNKIDQLEGRYLETFKLSINKWYQDDMGSVSELKVDILRCRYGTPRIYTFRNRFNKVSNKFSIKNLAPYNYFHFGFNFTNLDAPDWNNVSEWNISACGGFAIVNDKLYYKFNPPKFKNIIMTDTVTLLIDYNNNCFYVQINDVIAHTDKLPFDTHTAMVPYVILHEGEIQLL